MRLLGFIEYVMVLVGAVAMLAANTYSLTKGVYLGLFLVGAGIALGGFESIFTRNMSFRFTTLGVDHYAGAPALVWGWTILLIGATLIASAYLMDAGVWRTTVNQAALRPGGLLVLFGLVVAGFGALFIFAPRTYGLVWTLLVRVPKTIVGAAVVAAGVVAMALGIWEAVDPAAFTRVTREVLAQAGLLPFDYYWHRMLSPLL